MVRYNAFSLIEILMVVAIVGILSAIAIPAYSDYIIKSKVTDALSGGAYYKQLIIDYYESNGKLPTIADITIFNYYSPVVNKIRFHHYDPDNQRIEIFLEQISSDFNPDPADNHIWLTVTESNDFLIWGCGTHISSSKRIPCKYLPSNCQINC